MLNLWMKWTMKKFEISHDLFYEDGVTIVNCVLFFLQMWRCLKFLAFCFIIVNHMSLNEDQVNLRMMNFFWIRVHTQKTLPCFWIVKPSSYSIWRCVYAWKLGGYDVYWVLCSGPKLKVCLALCVFERSWAIWD